MERGGYRLVRVLGGAGEAEVSLCAGPDGEPVVLRTVGEEPADAAVAAAAADSPHVAPLLDLFSLPDDRFGLVYPRLPGGTLAQLVARRETLAPGEATTILVSVARALAALHEAGVAHGSLRTSCVLFDGAGAPVLADLTTCRPSTPEGVAADLRAFGAVAAAVLSRVPGSEPLLSRVTASEVGLEEIESELFAFADPCPVQLVPHEAPTIEQLLPSRSSPPAAVPPPLPEGVAASVVRRVKNLLASVRSVRRRVWVPALLVSVGLVAALLLVPQGGSQATVPMPTTTSVAGSPEPPSPTVDVVAVGGEDPVAAALALAEARDACLTSPVDGCLEAVDQAGSTLLQEDLAGIGPPAPTLPDPAAPAAVQRTGDAALVTVGEVRLLLIRVEKEWRLRDVFAAEPPSP